MGPLTSATNNSNNKITILHFLNRKEKPQLQQGRRKEMLLRMLSLHFI